MAICKCGRNMKLEGDKWVCICGCKKDVPYKAPDYNTLVIQNRAMRHILEDICECNGDLAELVEKARNLLQKP